MSRYVATVTVLAALAGSLTGVALAQEVVLPLDRYDQLRQRARWEPTPTPTPRPIAPAVIEAVELTATVGAASARVECDLDVVVPDRQWHDISFPPMGRLISADLGKVEGRVAAGNRWTISLRGSGRHRIMLELVINVQESSSSARPTWRMNLPLPEAAVVRGTLVVPDQITDLRFDSGAVTTSPLHEGRVQFVGKPGADVAVVLEGAAVVPERALLPLRLAVTTACHAEVGATRARVRGWVDVEVLQGTAESLTLVVPQGYELVRVHGEAVAGWDVDEDRQLKVALVSPVTTSVALELQMDGEAGDEVSSPVVDVPATTRSTAATSVVVAGDAILDVLEPGSGRLPGREERAQLPAPFRSAAQQPLIVTDPTAPPVWAITRGEATQVLAAEVDQLVVDVLAGEAGQASYQLWAVVRTTGARALVIRPPAEFDLIEAGHNRIEVLPGVARDGLVVPLSGSPQPQIVFLRGLVPLSAPDEKTTWRVPLPSVSAPIRQVDVRVQLPGDRKCELVDHQPAGRLQVPRQRSASGGSKLVAALGERARPTVRRKDLFSTPPGYTSVTASWTAMSASPGALLIDVEIEDSGWGWF